MNPSRPSKQTAALLAAERFKARFRDEKAKLQRAYCTLFKFWRTCRFKPCRNARACKGDADACLKRGVGVVSRDAQWQARQNVLDATRPTLAHPSAPRANVCRGSFSA